MYLHSEHGTFSWSQKEGVLTLEGIRYEISIFYVTTTAVVNKWIL